MRRNLFGNLFGNLLVNTPYFPTRGNSFIAIALAYGVGLAMLATPLDGQSLRGSPRSMERQNRQARIHDFTFLRNPEQVARFVSSGYLVRVRPNRDFTLHNVSFPYARPEAALFIRRLASQYRSACGEQLVVTSLTRPLSRQPANASARSVHPTGMAVDLRLSNRRACRAWLERTLLSLEDATLLEATRENYPAHYHIALFPQPYARYVDRLEARALAARTAASQSTESEVAYTVRRGDSLWTIAQRHGVTVEDLQEANDIRGSRIYAGQVISVPAR